MTKSDVDMGDTGIKPETATEVITPDPIAGFVRDARSILNGAAEPDENQQKVLMKSLMMLLAAAPAQQAEQIGEKNNFGPATADKVNAKKAPY